MGDLQNGGQLQRIRLRAVAQDPSVSGNASAASKSSAAPVAPAAEGDAQLASTSLVSGNEPLASSLVSGIEVAPQQPQGDVQVFQQDNVDGTICDCGEIPPVGGGFPKWPLLALIPLICVTGVCFHHGNKIPPPPTPPPPPPIPEPASLLLFGSGIVALSAGARRRYAKMRASKQAAATTEV